MGCCGFSTEPPHAYAQSHQGHNPSCVPIPVRSHLEQTAALSNGWDAATHLPFICLPSGRLVSLSLCMFSSRSNLYNHKKCPETCLSLGKHPSYIKGSNTQCRGSQEQMLEEALWQPALTVQGVCMGVGRCHPQISHGSRPDNPSCRREPPCCLLIPSFFGKCFLDQAPGQAPATQT